LGFTILAFSEVLASQLACNHSSGYQLKFIENGDVTFQNKFLSRRFL
jgi:hypothetical protein